VSQMPAREDSEMELVLQWGEYLLRGDLLDGLEAAILRIAPRWSRQAELALYADTQRWRRLELGAALGGLRGAVQELVDRAPPPLGSIAKGSEASVPAVARVAFAYGELKGAAPEAAIQIMVHEHGIRRIGPAWLFGNSVSIHLPTGTMEGEASSQWLRQAMSALCGATQPWFARAGMSAEFRAKNISTEGGGMRAIGVDVAKYLPGLYWMNFYGRRYSEYLGRERLLRTPAHSIRDVGDGILLELAEDPSSWSGQEYRAAEVCALSHLGTEHFFSRAQPNRPTVAQPFDLPPGRFPSESDRVALVMRGKPDVEN
jgi:hypothetical protein